MSFQNGRLKTLTRDGDLYLDDELIAQGVGGSELSLNGEYLVYKKDGKLYTYLDGKTTEYTVAEGIQDFLPAKGNRVVFLGESNKLTLLYTEDSTAKSTTVGENVSNLTAVYTWTCTALADYLVGAETNGAWYQNDMGTLVWRQ